MEKIFAGSCLLLMLFVAGSDTYAKGLNLDGNNQITICTSTPVNRPHFTLIFTSKPLAQTVSLQKSHIADTQLTQLRQSKKAVVLTVGGKGAGKERSCFDFFFGRGRDSHQPWNNGTAFHWQLWADYSDEIWDNLAIIYGATGDRVMQHPPISISDAVIRRGGLYLFDSRKIHSTPNNIPIDVTITPIPTEAGLNEYPVVDLSAAMQRFKQLYYELGNNPVLMTAYADLGQTDNRKYLPISTSWCSEFIAYAYREAGMKAPAPAKGSINWRVLKHHFNQHGKVYRLREVADWSQTKRQSLIKPGSLVSIVTDQGSSHTMLLTQWRRGDERGAFTAISGNNHSMVWHHRSISLPDLVKEEKPMKMSRREWKRYDDRSFVAVPGELAGD